MNEDLDVVELALTECNDGEEAEIVGIDVDSSLATRLRELGMVAGGIVRIARRGSPMILEIGEARVCLRGEEASRVRVRVPVLNDEIAMIAGLRIREQLTAATRPLEHAEWA